MTNSIQANTSPTNKSTATLGLMGNIVFVSLLDNIRDHGGFGGGASSRPAYYQTQLARNHTELTLLEKPTRRHTTKQSSIRKEGAGRCC